MQPAVEVTGGPIVNYKLSSLRNLFRRDAGGGGSIYEHIRSHVRPDGPGLTEGGMKLPDESDRDDAWFWGAGVKDGIASHHMGAGPSDDRVDEIFDLINRAGWRGGGEIQELEDVLATIEASSIVDPLLDRLRASQISAQELETLGRNLAKTSSYRSAVKIGIAMLGTVATRRNRDLITMLGRHDEFTLYSAVALSNTEADPEGALWELAKLVGGWGRIHLVERLRTTTRPEIQEWILRGGFRNSVMDEYLAYIAATTGGLTRALDVDDPDDELLNAACDIVRALIQGGLLRISTTILTRASRSSAWSATSRIALRRSITSWP